MDREEFEHCWHEHVRRVTAYAERHVGRDAAPDVASAAFLSAWLSWKTVPDTALPWLISAARGHIRNHSRSLRRQINLQQRLQFLDQSAYLGEDAAVTAEERFTALTALASMPDGDREALLLIAWEGLTAEEAAKVLGCRPGALRTRVHRARQRLDTALLPLSSTGSAENTT